jgi:hypothetical protein
MFPFHRLDFHFSSFGKFGKIYTVKLLYTIVLIYEATYYFTKLHKSYPVKVASICLTNGSVSFTFRL